LTDANLKYQSLGRASEFLLIEMVMFFTYMGTMILYLLKSRCINVGINHSVQFEPTNMALMANTIVRQMNFDIGQEKRSK